eukprot:g47255.t1
MYSFIKNEHGKEINDLIRELESCQEKAEVLILKVILGLGGTVKKGHVKVELRARSILEKHESNEQMLREEVNEELLNRKVPTMRQLEMILGSGQCRV